MTSKSTCPACGAKLMKHWPANDGWADEEFAYQCGALVLKNKDGKLRQDLDGACGLALKKALDRLNRAKCK